jgi:fluoroquinolone resistance protein
MEDILAEDRTYEKLNFREKPLARGAYENCRFISCDMSEANLSGIKFADCEFVGCNLSMAKLEGTAFRDIKFKDCKMLGLGFDKCSGFGMSFNFDGCILNHSTFYQTKILKTLFKSTKLQEVDFTRCDLTGSVLEHCDLTGAMFDNTVLEKADLRTSYNYSIDPERNKIKKATFSLSQVSGLLDKYNIKVDSTS